MDIERILAREMEISERIFGTSDDPDQIPITEASLRKLMTLSPESMQHELDANGDPIAWVVVVPTTQELMEQFLDGSISERQLFDRTRPAARYNALYFCSAVTLPEHRRRGLAVKLFKRAYDRIPHTDDVVNFCWSVTEDGRAMIAAMQEHFDRVVRVRYLA